MKGRRTTAQQKQPTPIDWTEVNRRMEKARIAIETGSEKSPDEKKKILKERAKVLAHEPTEKETDEEKMEVVEFLLSYERYGIESSYVREVYPLKEFTPVPCTPSFVLGIVNVRGQILSVIDIKKFFDLPEKGLSDLNKVIIIYNDTIEFGILADDILGVHNIPFSELQPTLPTLTGIREEYLKGITGEQVTVLDAEKLLSDKKIVVHEEV
jgi:purine-binding chemotaxis protein CheW